jgi:anti-anti-sigma factor
MLNLTVSLEDTTAVITITGEVDHHTAVELRRIVCAALAVGAEAVTLDVADMTFMDSSGLALLAELHQWTEGRGGRIVVRNPSAITIRLLDVTGMAGGVVIELHQPVPS